jgi:hypothetical protein
MYLFWISKEWKSPNPKIPFCVKFLKRVGLLSSFLEAPMHCCSVGARPYHTLSSLGPGIGSYGFVILAGGRALSPCSRRTVVSASSAAAHVLLTWGHALVLLTGDRGILVHLPSDMSRELVLLSVIWCVWCSSSPAIRACVRNNNEREVRRIEYTQ